jgi:hypothetical protein
MTIQKLLEYVRRTNPGMTQDKLLEELKKCRYASVGLLIVAETSSKPMIKK